MTAARRRAFRVWLPALAASAGLYVYAGGLTTTINGLGLIALLSIGLFTVLAAWDADPARKGTRNV